VGGATSSEEGDLEERLARLNAAATDGQITSRDIDTPRQIEDDIIYRIEHGDRIRRAQEAIDDGLTFPLQEYRVLSFCMANARDRGARRPIDGLHAFMSERLSVIRSRITRIFSDASTKLVEEIS
jgi:hypothetical protein